MAIAYTMCQKGKYFFKGYLAEVVLESNAIVFRDFFLALMPTKISAPKNITPPLTNLLSRNIVSITR
jgi:hypothetical protein